MSVKGFEIPKRQHRGRCIISFNSVTPQQREQNEQSLRPPLSPHPLIYSYCLQDGCHYMERAQLCYPFFLLPLPTSPRYEHGYASRVTCTLGCRQQNCYTESGTFESRGGDAEKATG